MSDSVCAEGCVFPHPETQPELLLCQWCVCGEEVLFFSAKQLLFFSRTAFTLVFCWFRGGGLQFGSCARRIQRDGWLR